MSIPKFTHAEDKIQSVNFGTKVKVNSIKPEIVDFAGFGGTVSIFYPDAKTSESDGTYTCRSGHYKAVVRPSRWVNDPWHMNGGYWDIRSDTKIVVEVKHEVYIAPPPKPNPINNTIENSEGGYDTPPPPDNEIEAPYGEEWVNTWKAIEKGFNYKCVDYYDRDFLGMGERRAKQDIINGLIPTLEAAKRLGSLFVFATGKKTIEYTFDIPPNLKIKGGRIIRGIYSPKFLNHNILMKKRQIRADVMKQNYLVSGTYVDRNK